MAIVISSESLDAGLDTSTATDSIRDVAKLTGRVPQARILMALTQVSIMNQNGIDLAEAIESAAAHARHPVLSNQLEQIHEAITAGQSVSAAFATHGQCFPKTFAPMLAAAEATGSVAEALGRMAEMMRNDIQLRSSVAGALIYPMILMGASFAVMLALVFGILPRFAEVFNQLGRPSPAITQFLLEGGTFCREHLAACIGGSIGLMIALFVCKRFPWFVRLRDASLFYLPMVRDAYRPLATGRLFRLIGSMIHGGVPLLDAVRLARQSSNNVLLSGMLENVEDDLLDGYAASRSFTEVDFLPPEACQMIATAERTGRLAEVLTDVGQFYEDDGARQLKKLVSLLEPVIILAMGVLVAGIVLSIMLPLLDVSTSH